MGQVTGLRAGRGDGNRWRVAIDLAPLLGPGSFRHRAGSQLWLGCSWPGRGGLSPALWEPGRSLRFLRLIIVRCRRRSTQNLFAGCLSSPPRLFPGLRPRVLAAGQGTHGVGGAGSRATLLSPSLAPQEPVPASPMTSGFCHQASRARPCSSSHTCLPRPLWAAWYLTPTHSFAQASELLGSGPSALCASVSPSTQQGAQAPG